MKDEFVPVEPRFELQFARQRPVGGLLPQGRNGEVAFRVQPLCLQAGGEDILDQHLGDGWVEAHRHRAVVVECDSQDHATVGGRTAEALDRWAVAACGAGWRLWLVRLGFFEPVVEVVAVEAGLGLAGHAFPLHVIAVWPEDTVLPVGLSFLNPGFQKDAA